MKRLQKELSRKEKRSNNYYKCKQKLSILYTKLKNARKYYLHKITKEITDNYDII
ncbi:MAG: transposase, partial [Eubacterium sp.]|nr:transposase [Eubacterium sp.]